MWLQLLSRWLFKTLTEQRRKQVFDNCKKMFDNLINRKTRRVVRLSIALCCHAYLTLVSRFSHNQ